METVHLECRNITFRYPQTDVPIFKNLNLTLDGPGFHGLFGLSGVGKSTLAKIIAGELKGSKGEVTSKPGEKMLYTSNLERLPGWSGVGDHVAKVTPPEQHGRMTLLLNDFGLTPYLNARFSQLSLGQKNRINLVRYLLQDFALLVMDESLANVDEAMREVIILKIKAMFPEKTFLYISHSVTEIARFCDRILILRSSVRAPRVRVLTGQNVQAGDLLNRVALERTMLEIVHAL